MAVENRRFSITQGIVLESALMQHFNNVADRAIKYLIARVDMSTKLFMAVIDGYKANADAKLSDVKLQVEVERGRIDAYIALLNKSKTEAEIAGIKSDALVRKYGVDVQGYSAQVGRGEALARVTIEQQRIAAQNALSNFQAGLQNAQNTIAVFMQAAGLKKEAAVAGGQIYGNYISAALNSISGVISMSTAAETTDNA